ncbi:hypothetical protein B0H19DRAFT_1277041 [Mycena capillaripes]|nr:hypothetical protein B0H19DRAFT_1277041 [Mycena capillaripes]
MQLNWKLGSQRSILPTTQGDVAVAVAGPGTWLQNKRLWATQESKPKAHLQSIASIAMPSFSSLITLCFLTAFYSLSAQAAPSTTGHAAELSARQVAVSNPYVPGPFPVGSSARVTGITNALFTQKVTITGAAGTPDCILQGSGEGIAMTVVGTPTRTTDCTLMPATTSEALPLSLRFEFSSTGPSGTFANAETFGNTITITTITEDSTDNDLNDTFVTIMVDLFPATLAPAKSITSTFERSHVESGLVFNPTDSITLSVDPFMGNSTLSDFHAITEDWNTVTGEIVDVHQGAPFGNVLVMRFLFSDSTNDELKNSSLLLNGLLRYTGTRPTGTPTTVQWFSDVVAEQSD